MRRILTPCILALLLLALAGTTTRAEIGDYTFSESSEKFSPMEKGETLIRPGTDNDDAASDIQKIGFPFTFNGTTYETFSVSSNGLFGFGETNVQRGAYTDLSGADNYPLITAF